MISSNLGLKDEKYMKLLAAGGGGAEDSRLLDVFLAEQCESHRTMLYLPIAMDGERPSYKQCYEWITSVFQPLGFNITMWTDLSGRTKSDVETFASVYIGGGNTFRLLKEIRKHHFGEILLDFFEAGGIIYGGSAGAIILGRDIMTCDHMDRNEVGLKDFTGLNLFNGYSIWCHYNSREDFLIEEFIQSNHHPVIAIPERSGVFLQGEEIKAIGFEPAYRFQDGKKVMLEPEEIQ